jgi:hypothetical protein
VVAVVVLLLVDVCEGVWAETSLSREAFAAAPCSCWSFRPALTSGNVQWRQVHAPLKVPPGAQNHGL